MKQLNVFSKAAVVAFALTLSTAVKANAETWILDLGKGNSKVDFHAVGTPKMLKIHGEGGKAVGQLIVENGKASGKATFDLNSLKTGISLRDSHMKDKYLEVEKHPNAIFELTDIKLPNPLPKGDFDKTVPFKGKMTVKGVAQNVSGMAKIKKAGSKLSGQVEFTATVKGFNIDIPSFAGVTMANEVKVQVEFNGPLAAGATRATASVK